MRIGIFGGSFDPVHREHVHFVGAAIDCLRLDKVFVMPAHTPPHKPYRVLSSDADRLEMCRLAFSHLPEVIVSDYEILQGGTSYTYLTCRYFRNIIIPTNKTRIVNATEIARYKGSIVP